MFDLQSRHEFAGADAVEREVEVQGFDRETLLVNWLNELLYLQEKHDETYSEFNIGEISETRLRARIRGRHSRGATRMIKAVTFHGLEIKRTAEGWEATVVVDV
jgi:SHS2 domain-containing protein